MTIKHRVEANSPEDTNRIAVELTLERTRKLEHSHKDLGFGSVDDRYEKPRGITSGLGKRPTSG